MTTIPTEQAAGAAVTRRSYSVPGGKPDKAQSEIAQSLANAGDVTKFGANVLGSMAGESLGPKADIAIATLAERYRKDLLEVADFGAITKAHQALQREQEIRDSHSLPLIEKQISAASEAYGMDPTPENLTALRHAKTLDSRDHDLAQQFAGRRMKAILADISPELKKVMVKASELCMVDAGSILSADLAMAKAFNIPLHKSPLVLGLHSRAIEFLNFSKAVGQLDGIPSIVHALLK